MNAQHGFQNKQSCEPQLLITVDAVLKSLANKFHTGEIFLDFSKAFNEVPHQHLSLKIMHYLNCHFSFEHLCHFIVIEINCEIKLQKLQCDYAA